jgi:putative ABC transport system substrate-binding protein
VFLGATMYLMNKRQFLLLGGGISTSFVAPSLLAAQDAKAARIGLLVHRNPAEFLGTLRQRFAELGYTEGRNIIFEARGAEGQLNRLPDMAAEMVSSDLDVIMAVGGVGARALQKATTKIPIVFAIVLDPVASGFAATMERPGGNITGFTNFDPQQATKQLELLKEIFPNLSRVAIASDQDAPRASDGGWNPLERANDTAARALGLQPQWIRLKGAGANVDAAFSEMLKEKPEALLILEVPATTLHQRRIAELAMQHQLPSMVPPTFSTAGGLIAYGTTILDAVPRIPDYVQKILKGANPGDLPIGVAARRELAFNLRTARAIGVTIPPEIVKRADQLVE